MKKIRFLVAIALLLNTCMIFANPNNKSIKSTEVYVSSIGDNQTIDQIFVDFNLAKEIAKILKKNLNDIVIQSELDSITKVLMNSVLVEDIEGLQYLNNLEDLGILNGTFSTLEPLSNLKKIKKIDIRNNNISDFSAISKLVSIEEMILSSTKMIDYEFIRSLQKLRVLTLTGGITSDLTPLSDKNKITDLSIKDNPNITDGSALARLNNLLFLTFKNVNIKDFSFVENFTLLKMIDISYSRLKDVSTIPNIATLKDIYLRNNEIEDVSQFSKFTTLRGLILDNNKISDLSPLSNLNFFAIHAENQEIEFEDNHITSYIQEGVTNLDSSKPNIINTSNDFLSNPNYSIVNNNIYWNNLSDIGTVGYTFKHNDYIGSTGVLFNGSVKTKLNINYVEGTDFEINENDVLKLTDDRIIELGNAYGYKNTDSIENRLEIRVSENTISSTPGDYQVTYETIEGSNLISKKISVKVKDNYTLTFDSQDGSEINSITQEENTLININAIPIKKGSTFLGWYDKNDNFVTSIMLNENITVKAKWSKTYIEASNFTMNLSEVSEINKKREIDSFSKILMSKANAKAWNIDNNEIIDQEINFVEHNIFPVVGEYNVTFKTENNAEITVVLNLVNDLESINTNDSQTVGLENTGLVNDLGIWLILIISLIMIVLTFYIKNRKMKL